MAHVNINISKIKYNAKVLQTVFQSKNIQFTPVIKCIAGDRTIVESLKALGINHVAESKLETFNIKLLIIQKVKQHNIKVYNFIIINNTSYKIKF
ncbi:alanine racemase [Staphylococcus aureus]|nr:alanine racemase [Staphylococcus aureus]